MYCHNCGKELPDGTKFCHYCGAEQPSQAYQSTPQPDYAGQASQTYQSTPRPDYAGQASQAYQSAPQPGYTGQPSQTYQSASQPGYVEQPPRERVGAGILGALLGSLAGVVVMVVLDRAGFMSALSGIVMLGGAVWGYSHFGKALSTKGVLLCVPIVIAMVYLGGRICWAIAVRSNLLGNPTFFDVFLHLPFILESGGLTDGFYAYLARQYGFAAIGVVLLLINMLRGTRAAKKKRR